MIGIYWLGQDFRQLSVPARPMLRVPPPAALGLTHVIVVRALRPPAWQVCAMQLLDSAATKNKLKIKIL